MGYYSFYRIIKDIIYNRKKHKLLFIIAIIILLIFLCNKVFASYDINIINPNNNQEVNIVFPQWVETDNLKYFFSYKTDGTWIQYCLFYFEENAVTITQSGSNFNISGNIYIYTMNTDQSFSYFLSSKNNITNFSKPNVSSGSRVVTNRFIDINNYYTNTNIKNSSGNVIFENNAIRLPQITTSLEDLQTLNFDTISVSANSWSDKDLYILFYDRSLMNNQNTEGLYPKKEIKLTTDTSYYIPEISTEQNAIYWIPNDNTGLNFKVGGKYEIRLAERVEQSTGRRFQR